jgi:hypothetical protein
MNEVNQHTFEKSTTQPQGFSKSFVFVLLLLFVLIAGAGGYWLGERANQNIGTTQQAIALQTLSITPTFARSLTPFIDSNIGNWKTYTNPIYRYSIQYPPNLNIIYMNIYMKGNIKNTMHSVQIGVPKAPGDQYPSLYIDVIPQNGALPGTYNNDEFMQNIKQYITSTSVGEVISPKNEPFNIQFIRRDNMTINGNTAYVFESMSFDEKRVAIQQNGILYVIGGYNPGVQFNQILSTFKFNTL